tara:strand:- start:3530 stop:4444 length:915 start_codon:yes stop_codon:yes gene_type:complete
MKTNIIAFAGTKQSGKTTCSNFLHGYQMKCYGVIDEFGLTKNGQLVIQTDVINEDGITSKGDAIIDINRVDLDFAEWAMYSMWPFVKKYSFAGSLKSIAMSFFGLKYDQLYGSEQQKRQIVPHLRWENMPGVITDKKLASSKDVKSLISQGRLLYHKKGPMSAREFLQFFGTDIMRSIYEPVWVKACIEDIRREEPVLAVIDDCRFINEIEAVQAEGGKVIGLDRSPYEDSHKSEKEIKENWDSLDAVIDNSDKDIQETNGEIIGLLDSWGWFGDALKPEEMPFPKIEEEDTTGIHTIKKVTSS